MSDHLQLTQTPGQAWEDNARLQAGKGLLRACMPMTGDGACLFFDCTGMQARRPAAA